MRPSWQRSSASITASLCGDPLRQAGTTVWRLAMTAAVRSGRAGRTSRRYVRSRCRARLMPDWVFGYGSLASPSESHAISDVGSPEEACLTGFGRRWDVAMWNLDPLNDSKHYIDPATGT